MLKGLTYWGWEQSYKMDNRVHSIVAGVCWVLKIMSMAAAIGSATGVAEWWLYFQWREAFPGV